MTQEVKSHLIWIWFHIIFTPVFELKVCLTFFFPYKFTVQTRAVVKLKLWCIMSSLHSMLALVVPTQIHFTLEALGANVASERFEARVFPAVGDQVGALAERFAAHLTLVRLFTYKIKHMDKQSGIYTVTSFFYFYFFP